MKIKIKKLTTNNLQNRKLRKGSSGHSEQSSKKLSIINMILIISLILICSMFLISAAEISTTSYNVSSFHTGTETAANSSTASYEFRHTTTYQQGSNRDVATLSYSANSGWLNNFLYINNDTLAAPAVCDANNSNLCLTSDDCIGAGGYWYNSICNEEAQTVTPPPSEGSPGGGGITGKITKEIEEEKIKVGTSLALKVLEKAKFTFKEKGKEHVRFIEILDITENSVLIVIYPREMQIIEVEGEITSGITGKVIYGDEIEEQQPISFRLTVGQKKFLDLTNDGSRDIYIELEKIERYKSYIYIESVFEEGEIGLGTAKPGGEGDLTGEFPEIIVGKIFKMMYFIIFGGLIIIFALLYLLFKHRIKIAYLEGGMRKDNIWRGRMRERKMRTVKSPIQRRDERREEKERREQAEYKKKAKEIIKHKKGKVIGKFYSFYSRCYPVKELSKHLKKPRMFIIIIFAVALISILSLTRKNIIGFVVNNNNLIISKLSGVLYFFLIIGILGFLTFIQRKNIKKAVSALKRIKHPTNSIKGLMKKEVYSKAGIHIGKVKDIILSENKIDSLKIKFNKKNKKAKPKTKGIVIDYKDVKDTGHIVIIDNKIMEKIEKEI